MAAELETYVHSPDLLRCGRYFHYPRNSNPTGVEPGNKDGGHHLDL